MHEEAGETPLVPGEAPAADRPKDGVWWATLVGVFFALVGLVAGLAMALEREPVECADATYLSEGAAEFACWVHPQGGLGIAIAALSVVLGILVVLVSMVARATSEAPTPSA